MGQGGSSQKRIFRTMLADTDDLSVSLNCALVCAGLRSSFVFSVNELSEEFRKQPQKMVNLITVNSNNVLTGKKKDCDHETFIISRNGSIHLDSHLDSHFNSDSIYYRVKLFVKDETHKESLFYEISLPLHSPDSSKLYKQIMDIYSFSMNLQDNLQIRISIHLSLSKIFLKHLFQSTSLDKNELELVTMLLHTNGFQTIANYMKTHNVASNHIFLKEILFPLLSFNDSGILDSIPETVQLKNSWEDLLLKRLTLY